MRTYVEAIQDAANAMTPKGDEPRKIVVCSHEQYPEVQAAVIKLGYGDVLVRPHGLVPSGQVYIIDPKALEMPTQIVFPPLLIDGQVSDA